MIFYLKQLWQRMSSFFCHEKVYTAVFLIVVSLLVTNHFFQLRSPVAEAFSAPSAEYLELKEAELRMKEELKDAASIEAFFKENPDLALTVQVLVIVAAIIFLLGLMILIGLSYRMDLRKNIENLVFHDPAAWNFAMLFKVCVSFVVLSLLISTLLSLIQQYLFKELSVNFMVLFQTTLVDIACLVLMVKHIKRNGGSWASLGFRIPEGGFFKEVLYGFLGYCCVFPVFIIVLFLLMLVVQVTGYEPEAHPLVNIFLEEETRSPLLILYSVFLATLIAPFLEEVFFRGFCYPVFKKEWGPLTALILSSSLFALIHQNFFAFFPIFVLGFALAYLYEKRRSLIANVTMHLLHNTLFIVYFFLVKKILTAI